MTTTETLITFWGMALILVFLWWLHYMEVWPFHGGRLFWPFKRKHPEPWFSSKLYDRYEVMRLNPKSYPNPHDGQVSAGDTSVEHITLVRKDKMTEGIYLMKNGKAHKCDPPLWTWKRGDTLNTVWQCPCGQKFKLVAREWKVKPVDPAYARCCLPEQREGVLGRKLSYADVLKKGNQERKTEYVIVSPRAKRFVEYSTVTEVYSGEDIINEDVSFSWEATE